MSHSLIMKWHAEIPSLRSKLTGFLVKSLGLSREDAKDVFQEALFKVERYCKSGREPDCTEALLKHTLQNLVASEHRQQHRYLSGRIDIDDTQIVDPKSQPDEVCFSNQCLQHIENLLDEIVGPKIKEMYFLHRLGGYSHEYIAERFQLSVSSVEKHIIRATATVTRERLHGKLRDAL